MKKLILITAFLGIAAISFAQTISNPVSLRSATNDRYPLDTTVSTTPKYQAFYATSVTATSATAWNVVGFQDFITVATLITKISGTVAGTLVFEGSLDGVTYFPIGTAFTITDVASQKAKYDNIPHVWTHYRVGVTLSGGVVSFGSTAIWRKR